MSQTYAYCKWNKLIRQISTTQSETKKTKFQTALRKYKQKDVNKFGEVKQKLMTGAARHVRSCTARGKAKVNENLIQNEDTQAMLDLEDILGEQFMDPAMFSNPEGTLSLHCLIQFSST